MQFHAASLSGDPGSAPPSIRVLEDVVPDDAVASYRKSAARPMRLIVELRWFTPASVFIAFFTVASDAFVASWYAWIFRQSPTPGETVFAALHILATVVLTYMALSALVNRTTIAVRDDRLTVRHEPLPWPGRRALPLERIARVYSEERERHSGYTFHLSAELTDGSAVRLLSRVPSSDQTRYLERFFGERLGK
jgi:hypothetical protein